MARIPYVAQHDIPDDLRGFLAHVPRLAAFDMLAHSVATVQLFLLQGQAQFTSLQLPPRTRELVILTTASMINCEYEFAQHVPISEVAGVSPSARQAIRRHDFAAPALSLHDQAITRFAAEIVAGPAVSDEVFAEIRQQLSDREIVEVIQVTGYYWSLGRMCTVLDVEIEESQGNAVVDASHRLEDLSGPARRAPGQTPSLSATRSHR